jgi:hypothetical protein
VLFPKLLLNVPSQGLAERSGIALAGGDGVDEPPGTLPANSVAAWEFKWRANGVTLHLQVSLSFHLQVSTSAIPVLILPHIVIIPVGEKQQLFPRLAGPSLQVTGNTGQAPVEIPVGTGEAA